MKRTFQLAAAVVVLAFTAGCPDQIAEGKDMMRGASKQEQKQVESQAKGAGAVE